MVKNELCFFPFFKVKNLQWENKTEQPVAREGFLLSGVLLLSLAWRKSQSEHRYVDIWTNTSHTHTTSIPVASRSTLCMLSSETRTRSTAILVKFLLLVKKGVSFSMGLIQLFISGWSLMNWRVEIGMELLCLSHWKRVKYICYNIISVSIV